MKDNKDYEILVIGDANYKTNLTGKFKARKVYSKPKVNEIKSFIPGTIREINVKEGSKVNEGDILLILEAMKMRNKIQSPIKGVIDKILVKTGDIVPKEKLLIVLK